MTTIPTVPSFTDGDSSETRLQQLSYAVGFLSQNDIRPTWHLYSQATQGPITANAWVSVATGKTAFDSDGAASSPGVTIKTQGHYAVEGCVPFVAFNSGAGCAIAFLVKAGSSNPHHSSGSSQLFGYKGGAATNETGVDFTLVSSELCPWVCYPGDQIIVQAYTTVSVSIDYNTNASYRQGRFVTNYTGMWVREGS